MWIVVKYKLKELKILKKNLTNTFGDEIDFYIPKIKYQKYVQNRLKTFEKFVLENYLICNHIEVLNTIFPVTLRIFFSVCCYVALDELKSRNEGYIFARNNQYIDRNSFRILWEKAARRGWQKK